MSRILFFTLAFLLGACGEAPSDWSTPSRLFPDLEGFPRTGILTTHRNTVHLALAYEVLDENARKVRSTVYVSRYEAGSWSRAHKLQGNANFSVYPSLVVDRNGTVHAFQVGFDSLTDETYLSSPFRRLLYARGQDTWDSLQTIFQGSLDTLRVPRALPIDSSPSIVYDRVYGPVHGVLDAQGKLHTVLWLERNEYRVAYLTQENAVWTMTQLADGIYPDIAIDEAGTLFIAYVDSFLEDGAPDGSFDSNSVLLISSSDGGATWSEPVLVSRSGKLQAHVPRILVAPEGRLHLLWEKDVDTQNILPEIIWHAYSDDGGASWSDPVEIQESTGMLIFGFDAVVDHFGRVHVIFTGTRSFDAPESHLYQSVWSCGAWSRPSQVFDRNNVNHQPLVAMDDSNRLYVVWTEHAPYAQPDSYNNWDKAYHTRREARAEGCWETVNSTS